jgi:hypothetical protein
MTTSSSVIAYSSGCNSVSAACFAITAAVAVAAAAVAVGVGAVAGVGTGNAIAEGQQRVQVLQQVDNFLNRGVGDQNTGDFGQEDDGQGDGQGNGSGVGIGTGAGGIAPTPSNLLQIPVPGSNFRNDGGCSDESILFADGNCHPVLRSGPCPERHQWLTVDPMTLKGRCMPRLCGSGRVFVGRDGLCHDADDRFECRGGRKLFYTAYGDPICDCPLGQFPFPKPRDNCVSLFTQGPCPQGEIVAINNATGLLRCLPDKCGGIIRRQGIEAAAAEQTQLLLLQADNGRCYPFGSSFSNNSSSIFDWVVYVPYSSELGFIIQTQSNSEYPLLSKLNSELTR